MQLVQLLPVIIVISPVCVLEWDVSLQAMRELLEYIVLFLTSLYAYKPPLSCNRYAIRTGESVLSSSVSSHGADGR